MPSSRSNVPECLRNQEVRRIALAHLTPSLPRHMALRNGTDHGTIPFMNTTVTLDSAGRVVIPKPLRDELGLVPGDTLALESDGERVMLRPVRSSSALRKEQGVWVFRGGRKIAASDTDRVLEGLREERARGAVRGSS